MAVWVYEAATDNIATSPALNRLLGFPEDATPSSEELRAGYLTGERERVSVIARAALARGEPYFEAEYEYRRRDGRPIWLLMRAEIMLDRSGEPERVVGVVLDITERKRAEEHWAILVEELNHRVKNTLAVVQSIATMSLRADADPALARQRFVERITALAKTHDVLTRENWTGAGLRDIFQQTVSPFDERISGRIVATGPDIWLPPRLAVSFSLMINELITNALKYGALSVPEGSVSLNWSDGEMFTLSWIERRGPPVLPPSRKGFGTALLHRGFVREINGTLDLRYEPEGLELAMRGTPPHLVPSADNMAAE
jgi:PAS domain S-box-containing protein